MKTATSLGMTNVKSINIREYPLVNTMSPYKNESSNHVMLRRKLWNFFYAGRLNNLTRNKEKQ